MNSYDYLSNPGARPNALGTANQPFIQSFNAQSPAPIGVDRSGMSDDFQRRHFRGLAGADAALQGAETNRMNVGISPQNADTLRQRNYLGTNKPSALGSSKYNRSNPYNLAYKPDSPSSWDPSNWSV